MPWWWWCCSGLTRLVLEGCVHVTDVTMEVVRAKLHRLTYLNIKVSGR